VNIPAIEKQGFSIYNSLLRMNLTMSTTGASRRLFKTSSQ